MPDNNTSSDPYAEKLARDEADAEQAFVESYRDVDWWAEEFLKRAVKLAKHWQLHHDPYDAMDRLSVAWMVLDDEDLQREYLEREKRKIVQAELEYCPKCRSGLMPRDEDAGAMWPYCRRCQKFVHPGDVIKKKPDVKLAQETLARKEPPPNGPREQRKQPAERKWNLSE